MGRPNVGKSSLFNRLLEQDRAIVTDIPGTTRDLVSEVAAINGIPVKLIDTAGIRESEGMIEGLGIQRSFQAMADADVTLAVVDLSAPVEEQDRELMARAKLIVGNKADLPRRAETSEPLIASPPNREASKRCGRRLRHRSGVRFHHACVTTVAAESLEYLDGAGLPLPNIPHEMLLLDLLTRCVQLTITGATTADDILNRIFSTFCIGSSLE